MIAFHNYRKQYGDTTIIGIPSLQLEQGVYWLKGENGSGKTTLIKSIAGLLPYHGDITVAGANIRKDRIAYTSIVNYAEAEPLYPDFLTGNDLIAFYAKTKKATPNQLTQLINTFGIASYAGNKIGTYSSGMTKKLSLVLGFAGNPKLVLLDEPLITLDLQSVANLQGVIEQYYAAGVSFLITSHQEIAFSNITPQRLHVQGKTLVQL